MSGMRYKNSYFMRYTTGSNSEFSLASCYQAEEFSLPYMATGFELRKISYDYNHCTTSNSREIVQWQSVHCTNKQNSNKTKISI